jgi:phospholipid/cholesterol/gamma-HCH transport system substrate-binding protein
MSVRRRRALGLVVLLAATLTALALWQRPNPFSSPEIVRADVADAGGLAAIGADVRVAGVPVGKVTGVTRLGNVARLTLSIDPSVGAVHRDATVALRPRLLFEGTAYVALTPGSPRGPTLGGAVIPTSQTSTYVPLADALSILRPRTRTSVRRVAGATAGLLSASAPQQLNQTIAALPRLTADTALVAASARGPHASELRSAVGSLAHVAATVASQAPSLRSSLADATRTFAALGTGNGRPLDQSLAALPGSAADLDQGAGATSAVLAQLQVLVPRLEPGARQLTPTITAIEPLLRQAVPVLTALSPLLSRLRPAISDATPAAGPTLAAMRALVPTVNLFQKTLLAALERRTDLGDPAYLAFLGLFAGGGGASRPFGVGGQGHFMRFGLRFLTGAGQPLPPCRLMAKVSPAVAHTLQKAGGCTP